jgi:predicted HTH domain antitoxin
MTIAIELPEDIAQRLAANPEELSRRALEALAVEAYKNETITAAEVRRMLGLPSRWETHAFLKEAGAFLHYDESDLEKDVETIERLLSP